MTGAQDRTERGSLSTLADLRGALAATFRTLDGFRRFRRSHATDEARKLYARVVEQARRPEFYLRCKVADTVDGRFDMIALHAFLLMRRLKCGRTGSLAQALFDVMFADMDQNLREMGIGDLAVGRKVKALAELFYGRVAAYEAGLVGDESELCEGLRRNLYRKVDPPPGNVAAMAAYVRREAAALEVQETDRLLAGEVFFGPPPGGGAKGEGKP